MKFEVIKKFADKYTGQVYNVQDIVEFSERRAKNILETGEFIIPVEEEETEKVEEVKEEKTEEKAKAKSTKKKSAKK